MDQNPDPVVPQADSAEELSAAERELQEAERELQEAERELLAEQQFARFRDAIMLEQNFVAGLLAGLVAAAASGALWAVIIVVTQRQFGLFAIVVGLIVGFAVRIFGKGLSLRFQILGASLAVLACLVGNVAAGYGSAAQQFGLSFADVLPLITPTIVWDVLQATTGPFVLLLWGIAGYEGYRFALRRIGPDEMAAMTEAAA